MTLIIVSEFKYMRRSHILIFAATSRIFMLP